MLERFQRDERGGDTVVREQTVAENRSPGERVSLRAVRARQREEYGGVYWGAACFGWLVAIGLGALLVGLLAAMGAAVGLTDIDAEATTGTASGPIGIGGALALALVVCGTLLAAAAGGKGGERYHGRIDRAGFRGNGDPE